MTNKILTLFISSLAVVGISSCGTPTTKVVTSNNVGLVVMPVGHKVIYVGGISYYYYGNSWYRRNNGRYIGCARPHGYNGSIGRHNNHYKNSVNRPVVRPVHRPVRKPVRRSVHRSNR